MSDKLFNIEIISATNKLYSGKVSSIIVPGEYGEPGEGGEFTILAGHAPLMASIDVGEIGFVDAEGNFEIVAVYRGFIEVEYDNVTIFADMAEFADQIDIERARKAKINADEKIKELEKFNLELKNERAIKIRERDKELKAKVEDAKKNQQMKDIDDELKIARARFTRANNRINVKEAYITWRYPNRKKKINPRPEF